MLGRRQFVASRLTVTSKEPHMRNLLAGVIMMIVLVPVSLWAQNGNSEIVLRGGIDQPLNPSEFDDGWNLGFGGGAGYVYQLTPIFGLMGAFDFGYFGLDDMGLSGVSGGAISVIYVSGGVRLRPMAESDGTAQPVFTAGLGYYRLKVDDLTIAGFGTFVGGDENALGIHLGGGLEVNNFLVEVLYIVGFTEGDKTGHLPIRVGYVISVN